MSLYILYTYTIPNTGHEHKILSIESKTLKDQKYDKNALKTTNL